MNIAMQRHQFVGAHSKIILPLLRVFLFMLISVGLVSCSSILPKAPIQPTLYVLDTMPGITAGVVVPYNANVNPNAPTLTVTTPVAAAGFGGIHIIYQRQAHELEHFALSQWIDTPAQMLTPLIVRTLENSGAFRAVVRGSTSAASELRLDTEIIRLQHEFNVSPSQVRFTLRAVLVDTTTRRVIAAREFEASVASPSEDTAGGVIAANQAVQRVLAELAKFSIEVAAMKSKQARP